MIYKTFFTSLLFILVTGTVSFAASNKQSITMTLPNSVVKEAISKSLPLNFPINSETLLGSIAIDKIENLKFKANTLSAHITLTGHKLNIMTSIAGHDLRMKIGSLTMSFQCDATTRFDSASQTLFLKPVITNLQSSDEAKTSVASTIALLFNNREFPLNIEKLKPIVADMGNKFLNISMDITSIDLHPDNLLLSLRPIIETFPKQK
jgi:hypothetical protein